MLRKRLNAAFGILFIAGIVYWLYPFVLGERQMQEFCRSLSIGSSRETVEAAVEGNRLRVSIGKEHIGYIHDPRAFGRFICEVRFVDDRLVSARYFLND
ncbi:MAG: hypothetical protein MUE46_05980 [Xanthomonadales bacterium]|jgi:hypothetical protein|nr:hypothetical protein [Xanthomonadales bacterium]